MSYVRDITRMMQSNFVAKAAEHDITHLVSEANIHMHTLMYMYRYVHIYTFTYEMVVMSFIPHTARNLFLPGIVSESRNATKSM